MCPGAEGWRTHWKKQIELSIDPDKAARYHEEGKSGEGDVCSMCGECLLGRTSGICPVTQCPKGMLNGPCGGVDKGMCEILPGRPCAWVQIYEKAKEWGKLESLNNFIGPKDYSIRARPEILVIEPRWQ
jgi:hypothetical protein